MLAAGQLVADRYQVDALLGEGGFGAVFAATDVAGSRTVALKCFKPDTTDGYDPRTRARFQREIEMVARLRCPHTVRLFDHGETDTGLLYMVFEHIEGEDLDMLLRRVGRLPVNDALHVLRQLLEAVAEAHAEGLLHRDIKSSNIRVSQYLDDPLFVKLLDFGLARGTDGGHPNVTKTGEFIGTPRYMAPEQMLDEPLTPATDIYCLGLVAYEMLFGRDVLSENSVQHQLDRLNTGHLIAPRARDGLPAHLVGILEKMTDRDPERRFQSVAAVNAALAAPPPAPRAMDEAPTNVLPSRPRELQRQRPWLLVGGIGLLVVALAVTALFFPSEPTAPAEPDEPIASKPQRTPTLIRSPQPSDDVGTAGAVPDADTKPCTRTLSGFGYLRDDPLRRERWYVYVPPDLAPDKEPPLLILLHQQGHNAETLVEKGGFVEQADEHGLVLIAPNDPDYKVWDPSEAHVAEIVKMRAEALRDLCVDERRVFLVGHGAGGSMSDVLMCQGWARAFANHAVARRVNDVFCEPVRPVPYALFYPKGSGYEPYVRGVSKSFIEREGIKEIEARWFGRNDCRKKPRNKTTYDAEPASLASECYEFDCETPFRSCHVGGGHGWPGTPKRSNKYTIMGGDGEQPDPEFPIAELIWEFFSKLEPLDPIEPQPLP